MKLIIVRHGQTEENVKKIIQSPKSKLTPDGIEQAKAVARKLKSQKITIAYISDFVRTKETAKEILKYHPKTKIVYTKMLREKNAGIFIGEPLEKQKNARGKSGLSFYDFQPPHGESLIDTQHRVTKFYQKLLKDKKYKDKTILVVTHQGPIIALLLYLLAKSFDEYKNYRVANTAITTLEINKQQCKIKFINSKLDEVEEYLKEKILPDLEKSRGGFDKIHTLEVVAWLKQIIKHNPELKLDETVLLIAAYAHDWGYSDIFKDGQVMNFELVENAKPLHMELGAKKIGKLLNDDFFSFLSDKQKIRCIHLVAVHDKKFEIKDIDELVLMEADMLSSLDINTNKPIYDAESNKKFMKAMLTTRIPKFITKFSKNEAKKLIQKRVDYYKKRKNCVLARKIHP